MPNDITPARPPLTAILAAEFFGTFWLVFAGCGSAVLAAGFPETGIGFLGVALAFGLTVVTMAYAVGDLSGGHFNPAVSLGMTLCGRLPWALLLPYWIVQVLGSIAAAGVLYVIATGQPGFDMAEGFATNGWGLASPGGYSLQAAVVTEVSATALFVMIVVGAMGPRAPANFAPIAAGFGLTLANLIAIPVTNASINPARSTGVALFARGTALEQLWLFWAAPLAGALLGGILWLLFLSLPKHAEGLRSGEQG